MAIIASHSKLAVYYTAIICIVITTLLRVQLCPRSIINHDQVEQTHYRTREGMKTTITKGRAAGGIAYGYRTKLIYDTKSNRIPGEREIDEDQAKIIKWIFEQYALGKSPKLMAVKLNGRLPPVPGPRGIKWRDTAIRGHRDRGTGILNNETYIGRLVFNRRNFRKNPETENREARMNDKSEWVINEASDLRIIDDALWNRVKAKQQEVNDLFAQTATNHLNAAHRPSYLLSGLLECAECSGSYAIMSKDRYGCINHKKRLPIDALEGACCSNQKTILRQDIETRVLSCVTATYLQLGIIDEAVRRATASLTKKLKASPNKTAEHKARLIELDVEQKNERGPPKTERTR